MTADVIGSIRALHRRLAGTHRDVWPQSIRLTARRPKARFSLIHRSSGCHRKAGDSIEKVVRNSRRCQDKIWQCCRMSLRRTKFDEYRESLQPVGQSYPQLSPAIDFLGDQQDKLFEIFRELCGAGGGTFFNVDLVLISAINRSVEVIQGFRTSYPSWNFTVAAPLVRLHIDTLLRLNYVLMCPADSGCVEMMLSGKPLRKAKDFIPDEGQKPEKLLDAVLVRKAAVNYPWLPNVYEKASGWVHMSEVHHNQTWQVEDSGAFYASCPTDISTYPYDFVEQLLWAMNETTKAISDALQTFVDAKVAAAASWAPGHPAEPPTSSEIEADHSRRMGLRGKAQPPG